MARKIVISLRKGGSGKTTTAVNLAAALAKKNKKTRLVDLDPQSNATISVGIDPAELEKHINTLFVDPSVEPEEAIKETDFGLFLLPSHPNLSKTEAGMKATQVGVLKSLLEAVDDLFDYIIIDTPPSESYLTVNALVVADEVIIPLQTQFLAMRGLQEAFEEIEEVRKGLNPNLKVTGILPTMVSHQTNMAKMVLDSLVENYGQLLFPVQINFSIRYSEASLAGKPIISFKPKHQGSQAYLKLADYIIKQEVK